LNAFFTAAQTYKHALESGVGLENAEGPYRQNLTALEAYMNRFRSAGAIGPCRNVVMRKADKLAAMKAAKTAAAALAVS
jgi:hypothetical protein